jgi:V/A-type H+-transporting ATPase subunit K
MEHPQMDRPAGCAGSFPVKEVLTMPAEVVAEVVNWTAPLAAAIAFSCGALATAWAQSRIGTAGTGTLAEKPDLLGGMIIMEAIPETMTILGFVVAAIILIM